MHRGDHLIVDQLVGGGGGELLAGDKFAQVERIVVRQQRIILWQALRISWRMASRSGDGWRAARWPLQRAGENCADKIGDPLGAGEI
jgi:hypothetical protein